MKALKGRLSVKVQARRQPTYLLSTLQQRVAGTFLMESGDRKQKRSSFAAALLMFVAVRAKTGNG